MSQDSFVDFLISRGYSADDARIINDLRLENEWLQGEVDHLKAQVKQLLALREPIDVDG